MKKILLAAVLAAVPGQAKAQDLSGMDLSSMQELLQNGEKTYPEPVMQRVEMTDEEKEAMLKLTLRSGLGPDGKPKVTLGELNMQSEEYEKLKKMRHTFENLRNSFDGSVTRDGNVPPPNTGNMGNVPPPLTSYMVPLSTQPYVDPVYPTSSLLNLSNQLGQGTFTGNNQQNPVHKPGFLQSTLLTNNHPNSGYLAQIGAAFGAAGIFALFDYLLFNFFNRTLGATLPYRVMQVTFQGATTAYLWNNISPEAAMSFMTLWWTGGCDIAFYGIAETGLLQLGSNWDGPGSMAYCRENGVGWFWWTFNGLATGQGTMQNPMSWNSALTQAGIGALSALLIPAHVQLAYIPQTQTYVLEFGQLLQGLLGKVF